MGAPILAAMAASAPSSSPSSSPSPGRDPWLWLAVGLGSGLAPVAPGTAGSLLAALAYFALGRLAWPAQGAAIGVVLLFGTVAAARAERVWGTDPGRVVIDEVAGQWLALLALPPTCGWIAAGFLLFRLFDITKPPPCHRLERLPGGLGVMADDLAAGLYARLLLLGAAWLLAG